MSILISQTEEKKERTHSQRNCVDFLNALMNV